MILYDFYDSVRFFTILYDLLWFLMILYDSHGFCLNFNKYNNINIKLRLEQNDEDFYYRKYIISKFFTVDKSDDKDNAFRL